MRVRHQQEDYCSDKLCVCVLAMRSFDGQSASTSQCNCRHVLTRFYIPQRECQAQKLVELARSLVCAECYHSQQQQCATFFHLFKSDNQIFSNESAQEIHLYIFIIGARAAAASKQKRARVLLLRG